ncbi:MAG: type II secretion system F family protein [Dethiobacter sp.]|jgi:Flp pilus assembly protein TadB|nr:type II secretion system F family protein [Dethiobacter sp.]
MLDLTLFSLIVGLGVAASAVLLYINLAYTAKESEKRRLEREERLRERTIKIRNLGWDEDLQGEAKKSGWSLSLKEYLLISGGAFLFALIVGIALKNALIAVGGGLVAYMLPRHVVKIHKKKEYKLKIKLLKPALQAISSAHTFKPNIVSAIQHALGSMQNPIKKEFELFLSDVETGTPVREALNLMKKRVNIKYLDFFVKAALMAEEEGGKTHELIKTCAAIIDQDMLVMEEFETEISKEKGATIQLMFLQFVMLGFLSVMQPSAFAAYTQTLFGRVFIFYILAATLTVYQISDKLTDTSLEEVG